MSRHPTTARAVYLRDHEAAAQGGVELFRRAARSQRERPWGDELATLRQEVVADHRSLRAAMAELGVRPDPLLGGLARAAEHAARWKPNGRLVGRAPLSDLIELEAAQDAVHAKAAGWHALAGAGIRLGSVDLDDLAARAEDQRIRLSRLHAAAAARVLAG